MQTAIDRGFLNENTTSASSIFGSMNGGLYTATPSLGEPILNPNHNSISPIKSSPLLDVDITAISPTTNGGQYHQNHIQQNQGPIHIPAKRLGVPLPTETSSGHRLSNTNTGNSSIWSSPTSGVEYSPTGDTTTPAVNGTSTNGTSFLQDSSANYNNNNTESPTSPSGGGVRSRGDEASPINHTLSSSIASAAASAAAAELTSQASLAMAATASYPTSHYSASLAAAEASRRSAAAAAVQQQTDTKLSSFWQNDYYKSATAASCLPPPPSVTDTCQPSAASFSHTAAAWNYPHPGGYAAAAALATPEQAAEARRQMAAADHFNHAADYTRLQYPHDGIYTHPPGKF